MQETIRTQRLEITDTEGKVIAVMGAREDTKRPYMALLDREGREMLSLQLGPQGPGDQPAPSLTMRTFSGRLSIDLGIDDGAGSLAFIDDGSIVHAIGIDDDSEVDIFGHNRGIHKVEGVPESTHTRQG